MILIVMVVFVVRDSIQRLVNPVSVDLPVLGIAVMTAASVVSFTLTRFLSLRARQSGSEVIRTESSHAWADGLANAAVVVGVCCSELGLARIDPAIGLTVSGLIGVRAAEIVRGASQVLTDAALVDVDEIVNICTRVPGVVNCHAERSRGGGGLVRIDLHIHVAPEMPVRQAHSLATQVESAIKEQVPGVAEVLVHIGADAGAT